MDVFKMEVDKLLENNSYPILLFCISNAKETSVDASRLFLEVFDFIPPNKNIRFELLKWILNSKNLKTSADIEDISNKTHGFVFEDLNTLVYYAQRNYLLEYSECNLDRPHLLSDVHFEKALG